MLKVLCIAGAGRSGSTILGNVLGEIDGFCHTGELRNIWDHGLIDDVLCGCGARFCKCPLWMGVARRAIHEEPGLDPRAILAMREASASFPGRMLMLTKQGRELAARRYGALNEASARVYRAIQAETGCRVIVDSSKVPTYVDLLSHAEGIALFVVHLVRDPRAVSYSWLRTKERLDLEQGRIMKRIRPFKSARQWVGQNLRVNELCRALPSRSIRVRYEDFVDDPRGTTRRILELVGESACSISFLADESVRLNPQHTLFGNPNRFTTGSVPIKRDDEWQSRMRRDHRAMVTAVTWPLMRAYGYGLAVGVDPLTRDGAVVRECG